MRAFFLRYATPFITGLFLVSLISGVALFLHVGPAGFHGMHEILSLVLVIPFVLHLWKNWRPMVGYFRHAPMILALGVSTVLAAAFLVPTGSDATGGPPQFQLWGRMITQPVAAVAPALGTDAATLTASLTAAGFDLTDPARALQDIATASGKTTNDLAAALLTAVP